MLQIQYFLPSPIVERAQLPAPLTPSGELRRRRLRLYLVGSDADTQGAIHSLHLLGYAERIEWSRVVSIPENGLLIRPDQGDVLRYLQRYRNPQPTKKGGASPSKQNLTLFPKNKLLQRVAILSALSRLGGYESHQTNQQR